MKKIYFFFVLMFFVSIAVPSFAQLDCSDGRYYNRDYFTQWDSTENILFGSGPAVGNGQTQNLHMTVFEPQGDQLAKRPLVVLTFGGSFVTGQRSDIYALCLEFVRMGYVAAATDYRVGFFMPSEVTTTQAVVRGMHDMKAAVRYFYKDAQTVDQFKIDTNYIIVGGVSAGAICALHTAYLNDNNEIPSYLANDTAGMGGVEGLSGNPGYSSKVAGVIDFSGTLGDTAWIKPGDAPIVGLHDLADNTVPFGTGPINAGGFPTGLTANGTGTIMLKTDMLQIPNALKTYPGSGHVSYFNGSQQKWDEAIDFVKEFIGDLVCGSATLFVQNNDAGKQLSIYPNPSNGSFTLSFSNSSKEFYACLLTDITGRVVRNFSTSSDKVIFDCTGIPAGIYAVAVSNDKHRLTERVVLK